MTKVKDLTYDIDVRGDYAFFIETKHFKRKGLSEAVKKELTGSRWTFFRVIENGIQQSSHGYIDGGEIVQWG